MAYNQQLADRVRRRLQQVPGVEEKAMMGGLAFMVQGKMCVGIIKNDLMCRIDKELHETAVEKTGCRTMQFTGRPMKGFVLVDDSGMHRPADFEYWINLALEFNPRAKKSRKR